MVLWLSKCTLFLWHKWIKDGDGFSHKIRVFAKTLWVQQYIVLLLKYVEPKSHLILWNCSLAIFSGFYIGKLIDLIIDSVTYNYPLFIITLFWRSKNKHQLVTTYNNHWLIVIGSKSKMILLFFNQMCLLYYIIIKWDSTTYNKHPSIVIYNNQQRVVINYNQRGL